MDLVSHTFPKKVGFKPGYILHLTYHLVKPHKTDI